MRIHLTVSRLEDRKVEALTALGTGSTAWLYLDTQPPHIDTNALDVELQSCIGGCMTASDGFLRATGDAIGRAPASIWGGCCGR